jgi:hypothetical protein
MRDKYLTVEQCASLPEGDGHSTIKVLMTHYRNTQGKKTLANSTADSGHEHHSNDISRMSENLLGKKVHAKGKTGEIVRVYTVLGLKESERVNVRWNDGTVRVEMRLSDLQIVDVGPDR